MSLNRDVAEVLKVIHAPDRPAWNTLSPEAARASYLAGRVATAPEPMPVAEVRDLSIPGPHGPIPLRLYRPMGAPASGSAALAFFHGGGWVLGNLESHDAVCRHLAERTGCIVLAVDYRLAPEHKFPAAPDDAFAATQWLAAEAASLGVDPARIAVGGDSAGGNLAAVVCLMAREAGGPAIAFQLLLYPATDFSMDTASHHAFGEGHLLTRASMGWFRDHYLNHGGEVADWRASPLQAASVEGLPPAYVLTASHDPLRDEGEAYARRLVEAGIPVTLWRAPGLIHGFLPMGKAIAASGPALDRLAAALQAGLAG